MMSSSKSRIFPELEEINKISSFSLSLQDRIVCVCALRKRPAADLMTCALSRQWRQRGGLPFFREVERERGSIPLRSLASKRSGAVAIQRPRSRQQSNDVIDPGFFFSSLSSSLFSLLLFLPYCSGQALCTILLPSWFETLFRFMYTHTHKDEEEKKKKKIFSF